jgi:hypothetical protein
VVWGVGCHLGKKARKPQKYFYGCRNDLILQPP